MGSGLMLVVIRFQICIFDILNTADPDRRRKDVPL